MADEAVLVIRGESEGGPAGGGGAPGGRPGGAGLPAGAKPDIGALTQWLPGPISNLANVLFNHFVAPTMKGTAQAAATVVGRQPPPQTATAAPQAYGPFQQALPAPPAYGPFQQALPAPKAAGGGAAMLAGINKFVGAYAAPAAVAYAAFQALEFVKDKFIDAGHAIGFAASAIASPEANPAVQFQAVGAGLEKFGHDIFILSPALGFLAGAAGAVTGELGKFMSALDGLTKRYSAFNPALAQAEMQSDMRQMLGDIRRGQELGPILIRHLEIRAELQQRIEDLKVRLLTKIAPYVLNIIEKLVVLVEMGEKGVEVLEFILSPLQLLQKIVGPLLDRLGRPEATPDAADEFDAFREFERELFREQTSPARRGPLVAGGGA